MLGCAHHVKKVDKNLNYLPLCCSVALTLDSDHVDPQQTIQGLQCNACHFRVSTL